MNVTRRRPKSQPLFWHAALAAFFHLVAFAGLAQSACAHPIHTAYAEADYNAKSQKVEIALRVFADDFERALTSRAGRKISLEKTPAAEFDALASAYVKEHFTLKLRSQSPIALSWLGRELKDAANELWFYFEAPLPDGVDGLRLRHALLTEIFSDQLNSVRVRDGRRQTTLLFPPPAREQTVRFPP